MNQLSVAFLTKTGRRRPITRLIAGVVPLVFFVILNVALAADQSSDSLVHKGPHTAREGVDPAIVQYVEEASKRFLIPSSWIWAVMKTESAGDVRALSSKGAMGLMQIMPRTWEMLRQQHALGRDPYDPRDNILAGAAYLRELHDRYGEGGFLAAYNAGPGRYEEHLSGRRSLPAETVEYVLNVSRRIGFASLGSYSQSARNMLDLDASSIFPTPKSDLRRASSVAENHTTERSLIDQHVVDLSALTPSSTGIFVRTSRE